MKAVLLNRKGILLFIVLIQANFGFGQATGYMGKKFIIKTNIVNGMRLGFNNCDLEYVVGRRIAINASYQLFDYTRGQTGARVRTGVVSPGGRSSNYKEISYLKNGETSGWIASVGAKLYFDKIVPAPWGFYTEFNIGIGSAKFQNFTVSYDYKEKGYNVYNNKTNPRPDVTGLSGESKIVYFEIPSFGYQRIFKRLVTLDAKVSVQGQYCPSIPDEMLNALEHNYYVHANTISYGYNNLSLGLAFYVKLGFLLF